MASENERKYPLGCWIAAEQAMTALPGVAAFSVTQGYLSPETRIRRFEPLGGGPVELVFSYKRSIPGSDEPVEIEAVLDEEDYVRLAETCTRWLQKRRYKLGDMQTSWDVDFFTAKGAVYFALAEAEMPSGQMLPGRVLPALQPHALGPVPRAEAGRFSSYRLCDPAYGRALATEFGIGPLTMPQVALS